ncbi:MAG: hypothetical protein KC766_03075 [Myxococcales bacterium]|nr:hypothetical protein [Myxococcales bacterium]
MDPYFHARYDTSSMPVLTTDQIKSIVTRFIPLSVRENPFVTALLAGAAAVGVLLATPAFAPIGVVGATGWVVVYLVTGGTFSYEVVKKAWAAWREMTADRRDDLDAKLEQLRKARDEGALSEDEYKARAKKLLDEVFE